MDRHSSLATNDNMFRVLEKRTKTNGTEQEGFDRRLNSLQLDVSLQDIGMIHLKKKLLEFEKKLEKVEKYIHCLTNERDKLKKNVVAVEFARDLLDTKLFEAEVNRAISEGKLRKTTEQLHALRISLKQTQSERDKLRTCHRELQQKINNLQESRKQEVTLEKRYHHLTMDEKRKKPHPCSRRLRGFLHFAGVFLAGAIVSKSL